MKTWLHLAFKVTVFKPQASKLAALNKRLIGIKVGDFWYVKGLLLGQLYGNRFTITLRGVSAESEDIIKSSAVALGKHGFINYFGLQVFGSITGVRLIIAAFPNIGRGPRLSIDIHGGALTEGCLAFAVVSISLGLSRRSHVSTLTKTWISSLSKLTLHILGSVLTGGCMNPASVIGWAYARGDHITKEHIHVYWLAPIQATLLAVWTFNLLVSPLKDREEKMREKKSE